MRTSLSAIFQVHDDDSGERIEVGEDADGLELVWLRWGSDPGDDPSPGVLFQRDRCQQVIDALVEFMSDPSDDRTIEIYRDHDETLSIQEDPDGLGLIDISWWTEGKSLPSASFNASREMGPHIVKILRLYLKFLSSDAK